MKLFKTWLSLMFVAAPALAAIPAHPGMLNYVEGQARINGQTVTNRDVGTAEVAVGQVIETGVGKAEILLTPGVFLRLGDNSAVRMDAAGLIDTRVAILRGRALIEADNLQKGNNISVLDGGAVSRLEKNGIYTFSTNPAQVETFDGKVQVTENDKSVELGKGHETSVQIPLHSAKFELAAKENDPLYQWSKVRSEYDAEANMDQARTIVAYGGWYGPGWYWDPWFDMYSWMPGYGAFWNPFGFGFYSPGFYRGYYGGFRGGFTGGYRYAPAFRGGGMAFRGGGGFHGGGGRR